MGSSKHQLTRRRFLQHAGVGAAGAASAALIGGRALGPASAVAQDTPKSGGTLTLSVAQKTSFSHFMFLRHYAGGENIYSRTLANARLVTLDHNHADFIPDLAQEWAFSADGKQVTFTLRPGLTWHDGQPFTSADVNFTFHMIGIPGVGDTLMGDLFTPYVVGMQEWLDGTATTISGLTTPDDLTVTFDLFDAFSQIELLTLFNQICIAPNHILSQYLNRETGKDILQSEWATTSNHVGIGPFRVSEYVADQYIIYAPFENYYRGRPLLDEIVYRPFLDATTNAAALENKEVDVGRVAATDYPHFQELDFLNFVTGKRATYTGTPFNARQPYLNQKVRQALIYALDRDAIVQTLYAGAVDVIHSPISVPQYGDSPNLIKYNYDPEKAKALLAEGGWDSGRKIRWAISAAPSSEADQAYYAAINGYWAEVGVEAEFQVFGQDASGLWAPNWDFDLYPSAYPIGLPGSVAIHLNPRQASYVSSGYDTPEFQALWDDAQLQHDEETMKNTIWKLQETIAEQALTLMIARSTDIWGINKRVHELSPLYMGYESELYDWQIEKVWVD
jgi:peptide/nickel transport system substrate-binding protein